MSQLQLTNFIMRDFVYKQNPDGSYLIKDCELEKENRNDIIDTIQRLNHFQ